MAKSLSPEVQIVALRRELAQRDAIIAAHEAERVEAAIVKAKLAAALLEIEQIKMQLATLRRQRYGRSSEKLDNDIVLLCHKILARFDMRLSVMEILTRGGELWVSNPRQAAANHGLPPMSRRLRRCWVTRIA